MIVTTCCGLSACWITTVSAAYNWKWNILMRMPPTDWLALFSSNWTLVSSGQWGCVEGVLPAAIGCRCNQLYLASCKSHLAAPLPGSLALDHIIYCWGSRKGHQAQQQEGEKRTEKSFAQWPAYLGTGAAAGDSVVCVCVLGVQPAASGEGWVQCEGCLTLFFPFGA